MIKLIVSDMDGTLLNDKLEVSDTNAEAIKQAQQNGIDFIIATGRNYEGGYPLVQAKDITCPFIGLNGAVYYDKNGKLEYSRGLEKNTVFHLKNVFEETPVYFELITNNGIYSNNKERHLEHLKDTLLDINEKLTLKELERYQDLYIEKAKVKFISDYNHVVNDDNIFILKMTAQSIQGEVKLTPLRDLIYQDIGEVAVTASSRKNLEVTHNYATKANAVESYANRYGLNSDEVMTIGDNLNDLTMIKWAKYGIAMENAVEETKSAAYALTSNNEENGVAEAISRVLNGNIYQ